MRRLCWLLALACAPQKSDLYLRPPADRARVEVIELGWNAIEDPRPYHPPVVDLMRPKRYRGLALDQAKELTDQCNAGHPPFEKLVLQNSETNAGPISVEAQSKMPYRDAALRLRVGECAMVEGPTSDYVVKRLE